MQLLFDEMEALLELRIGGADGRFGIDVQMAGEIGYGKEQIANLVLDSRRLAFVQRDFDFPRFLANFFENEPRIIPIEANCRGFGLKFHSTGQAGQG